MNAVHKRAAAGRLHRIHRGVYAIGHDALSPDGRRMAAVLACGLTAVLGYRSAADLYNIIDDGRSRFDVIVPGRGGGRRGPAVVHVHRTRRLDPCDIAQIRGLPVTTLARTLVDLADVVGLERLQHAVHEAEVLRILDVAAVREAMARLPGRRGTANLDAALGVSTPDPDNSKFVAAYLRLCNRHGLPRPETTAHLDAGLPLLSQIDLYYPDARLVIELDGEQTHLTRKRFHSDRRRDAGLAARDIQTLRYTWTRVTRESAQVAAEVRAVRAIRLSRRGGAVSRP
jgi:hypothetical protein